MTRQLLAWALLAALLGTAKPSSALGDDIAKIRRSDSGHAHDLDGSDLALCDCEPAAGSAGLACDKEGYFISGFEREGQWLAGGGLVPLSRALCCRPCLPMDLPTVAVDADGSNATALAIVSIGCHKSTARGAGQLQCESPGSLVAGYAQSNRVNTQTEAYYPLGAAECCTAGVLLSNGDAWELEQCNCRVADGISCGGQQSGKLLAGYEQWRMTIDAQYVPIAPANCCKLCLGQLHKMSTCAVQDNCSGHGVCILGQCECLDNYRGSNCSIPPSFSTDGLPMWAIVIIVMGSCLGLIVTLTVIGRVLRLLSRGEEGSEEGGDDEEPLLSALHEEAGSVGSTDTTDCDSDDGGYIDELARATDAVGDAEQRTADVLNDVRMQSVEALLVAAHRQFPDNVDAGIEYALREMRRIIVDAEQGDGEAVQEAMQAVEGPLVDTVRATYRAEAARVARQAASSDTSNHRGGAGGPSSQAFGALLRLGDHLPNTEPATASHNEPQLPAPAQNGDVAIQVQAQDEAASDVEDDEEAIAEAAARAEKKAALLAAGRIQAAASGPLATLDCSVCLTRPIQVAVIPVAMPVCVGDVAVVCSVVPSVAAKSYGDSVYLLEDDGLDPKTLEDDTGV
eukprot:CAMPEP_0206139990 /NCGR_PEP_ID=MMETSP1473-20131121/7929_1 /ASSEMBLY_ACC=CAM_ASM_001109 /TAXON_ID=1461547 /ORGANISM="Stichococcus sp, Strain RCC1054" /LENGTH=623 /DNA_ID=CAMNT_0053533959 /DNA_START=71 /DNA_END=1944 /DNA_ORIENTATION=-